MKKIFLALVLAVSSASAWSLEVGKQFPELSLTVLDGKKTSVSQLLSENKVTLVEFWAAWCSVCKKSFPEVDALAKQHADKGFGVLGLNTDDDLSDLTDIRKFLKDTSVGFPIVLSNAEEVYEKTKIKGVPTAALVDSKGKVLAFYTSMRKAEKAQLKKDLATYLK